MAEFNGCKAIEVRDLGLVEYLPTWQAMRHFTDTRMPQQDDQIWVCEHRPIFTLGLAGNPAHVLKSSEIPVCKTDRGGQVTYHGPGQLVIYPLLDLRRYNLRVREYVHLLEQSVIDALVGVGVADAQRKLGAPGVYTRRNGQLAKIAALGIKVRKGFSYHGLCLNVSMDLTPFQQINPCGYVGLETVDLHSVGVKISLLEMQVCLIKYLIHSLESAMSRVV